MTRIVDCIREITNSNAEQEDCSRRLLTDNRRGKEEPVSFVLSIEPVGENVVDLTDSTKDTMALLQQRNPKAVFVMLPNIQPDQLGEAGGDAGGEDGDEVVDGFLIDNIRAEALVADNERDDGSGEVRSLRP